MRVTRAWTPDGETSLEDPASGPRSPGVPSSSLGALAEVAFACSTAELAGNGTSSGDPTEVALLELAAACGLDVSAGRREAMRRALFRFDPRIKLMTTVDQQDGGLVANTKGAPEEVLARATRIRRGADEPPITAADRDAATQAMDDYARQGLRVLAFGHRTLPPACQSPASGRTPNGTCA
jgi:magnesium-transporting ATPase (P-type)